MVLRGKTVRGDRHARELRTTGETSENVNEIEREYKAIYGLPFLTGVVIDFITGQV